MLQRGRPAIKTFDHCFDIPPNFSNLSEIRMLLDAITIKHKDDLDKEKMLLDAAIKLTGIEATAKADEDANFLANQKLVQGAEETVDMAEGEGETD